MTLATFLLTRAEGFAFGVDELSQAGVEFSLAGLQNLVSRKVLRKTRHGHKGQKARWEYVDRCRLMMLKGN